MKKSILSLVLLASLALGGCDDRRITKEQIEAAKLERAAKAEAKHVEEVNAAIEKRTLLKGMTVEEATAALRVNLSVLVREDNVVAYRATLAEGMYVELAFVDGRLARWAQNF